MAKRVPKYARVAAAVQRLIADGTLRPGQPAPSGAALSRVTGYSTLTCRRALRVLVADGVLSPGPSPNARPRVAGPPQQQAARDLAAASRALSAGLATRRRSYGLTQPELAVLIGVSVTTIGHAETGRLWQSRQFWEHADAILDAGGDLLGLHDAFGEASAANAANAASAASVASAADTANAASAANAASGVSAASAADAASAASVASAADDPAAAETASTASAAGAGETASAASVASAARQAAAAETASLAEHGHLDEGGTAPPGTGPAQGGAGASALGWAARPQGQVTEPAACLAGMPAAVRGQVGPTCVMIMWGDGTVTTVHPPETPSPEAGLA